MDEQSEGNDGQMDIDNSLEENAVEVEENNIAPDPQTDDFLENVVQNPIDDQPLRLENSQTSVNELNPAPDIEENIEQSSEIENQEQVKTNKRPAKDNSPDTSNSNRKTEQLLPLCAKCQLQIQQEQEKAEEPPNKKLAFFDNDEGACCSICLENWSNVGEHRVSSLKCGHLFGFSCIKRWITESSKTCPTCKKKASLRDLRYIYASKLIAIDMSELDKVKRDLDKACQEKNILEQEMSRAVVKHHKMLQQADELRQQITNLTRVVENQKIVGLLQKTEEPVGSVRAIMDKALQINKDGGCRVLDCHSSSDLLVVSTKSSNLLFNGFGIKKITISAYRPTTFIPLHSKPIRDVSFQPQSTNFLTVSLDKSFKLLDSNNNFVVLSKATASPLWSCCWDVGNPFYFYVGEHQGATVQYDVRNVAQPLNTFTQNGDMSPVVSLASVLPGYAPLYQGGLVCCKLNKVYVYSRRGEEYDSHLLSLAGPFVSMRTDSDSQQFIVSTRPTESNPHSRHSVINLDIDPDTNHIVGNSVYSFKGGSVLRMLSRSAIVSGKNNTKYVAAYEESHRAVLLWSMSTGRQVCSIPAHEFILDLCGFRFKEDFFLATLSEKKLAFFKYS